MQLGMGDLMDQGGYGLYLAHALPDGDGLILWTEKAVHLGGQGLEGDRDRGGTAQRLHKNLVLLNIAGQTGGKLGQRPAGGLRHVEHLHRLEHRDIDLLFLDDGVAVLVQQGRFGVRIQLDFLHLFLKRSRGDDGDAVFTLPNMTAKLLLPLFKAGHQRGVWLLHIDEHGVVEAVPVEPAHHGEILPVAVTFKQLRDTLLDAVSDFLQPFLIGFTFWIICHRFSFPGTKAPPPRQSLFRAGA